MIRRLLHATVGLIAGLILIAGAVFTAQVAVALTFADWHIDSLLRVVDSESRSFWIVVGIGGLLILLLTTWLVYDWLERRYYRSRRQVVHWVFLGRTACERARDGEDQSAHISLVNCRQCRVAWHLTHLDRGRGRRS